MLSGKTYFYRVTRKLADGRAPAASAVAAFTTPVENPAIFSFAVLADTHQAKHAPDLLQRLLVERPDFIIHGGDRNPPANGLIKPSGRRVANATRPTINALGERGLMGGEDRDFGRADDATWPSAGE